MCVKVKEAPMVLIALAALFVFAVYRSVPIAERLFDEIAEIVRVI